MVISFSFGALVVYIFLAGLFQYIDIFRRTEKKKRNRKVNEKFERAYLCFEIARRVCVCVCVCMCVKNGWLVLLLLTVNRNGHLIVVRLL